MTTTELQKQVKQVKRHLDKPVQGAAEDFAAKLTRATQLRARKARAGVTVSNDDSFARKLVDTTKRFAASRGKLSRTVRSS
jgi:hypothetical protein